MQELISLCLGVLIGGFIGFDVGAKRIVDKAEIAAQRFIDEVRARFGSEVKCEVEVSKDGLGNPVTQTVELIELPKDVEDLGAELFKLK